jgi:hypothetical protein
MSLAAIFLFLAASFWETKAPADWTDNELVQMFTDSPWGQMVQASAQAESHSAPVDIFLATAGPIVEAENERERRFMRKRNGPPVEDPMAEEYQAWLEDNKATQIVVAARIPRTKAFDDGQQTKRMEDDSIMRVGRKRYKMTGNFPPTERDPYLRLAFPRQVSEADKMVTFELYLPGVAPPYRTVEFKVKDLMLKGKLEL